VHVSAPDNIKITCCIQRQNYAGRCPIFSKINFVLEELRQVDFARYNKKSKAPLLLLSLLFFSFIKFRGSRPRFHFPLSTLQTSRPSSGFFSSFDFFPFSLRILKNQHLTFPRQFLLFHRIMFTASSLLLFQSNWLHSDQFQLFQQQVSFPLMALK